MSFPGIREGVVGEGLGNVVFVVLVFAAKFMSTHSRSNTQVPQDVGALVSAMVRSFKTRRKDSEGLRGPISAEMLDLSGRY